MTSFGHEIAIFPFRLEMKMLKDSSFPVITSALCLTITKMTRVKRKLFDERTPQSRRFILGPHTEIMLPLSRMNIGVPVRDAWITRSPSRVTFYARLSQNCTRESSSKKTKKDEAENHYTDLSRSRRLISRSYTTVIFFSKTNNILDFSKIYTQSLSIEKCK